LQREDTRPSHNNEVHQAFTCCGRPSGFYFLWKAIRSSFTIRGYYAFFNYGRPSSLHKIRKAIRPSLTEGSHEDAGAPALSLHQGHSPPFTHSLANVHRAPKHTQNIHDICITDAG